MAGVFFCYFFNFYWVQCVRLYGVPLPFLFTLFWWGEGPQPVEKVGGVGGVIYCALSLV